MHTLGSMTETQGTAEKAWWPEVHFMLMKQCKRGMGLGRQT